MKLFAPLVIASANAITCSVCEETTIQTLSSDFTTSKDPTGHLDQLNGCYQGNTNTGVQYEECEESACFALFFTYRGVNGNGETFYTHHAERGCKQTRKYLGKEVDFPSSTDCSDQGCDVRRLYNHPNFCERLFYIPGSDNNNGCEITLTKENFGLGNQGSIKGVYFQSATANTVTTSKKPSNSSPGFANSLIQTAPMKCYQCSSGASLANESSCFDATNAVSGHCPDFRSTSCFSRTSWYTAPKESSTAEYKMAERGCSSVPADEAKNRQISYFIGEVPREPEVDFELERREIVEESCDTENCNDFKPAEKSTSGAAAFSALTSLLIAMAFNN